MKGKNKDTVFKKLSGSNREIILKNLRFFKVLRNLQFNRKNYHDCAEATILLIAKYQEDLDIRCEIINVLSSLVALQHDFGTSTKV